MSFLYSNIFSGYLYLKGANRCSSRFTRKFGWYDDSNTNYLTIEYYVTGPGPFSLSVSNEKRSRLDWMCSIEPGKKRRLAHVSVGGDVVRTLFNKNSNVNYNIFIEFSSYKSFRRKFHLPCLSNN